MRPCGFKPYESSLSGELGDSKWVHFSDFMATLEVDRDEAISLLSDTVLELDRDVFCVLQNCKCGVCLEGDHPVVLSTVGSHPLNVTTLELISGAATMTIKGRCASEFIAEMSKDFFVPFDLADSIRSLRLSLAPGKIAQLLQFETKLRF